MLSRYHSINLTTSSFTQCSIIDSYENSSGENYRIVYMSTGVRIAHLNLQPESLLVKTRPNHLQDSAVSRATTANEMCSWQYLLQLKLGGNE